MVYLLDTTLREGEQAVAIHFSTDQKKRIVDGLAQVGISEVEVGIASPLTRDLPEMTDYCRLRHPGLRTSLWCRCREDDIRYAATLGPGCLSLSLPASDLHLTAKLGRDRAWAESTLPWAIGLARGLGLAVAVGFEDATRADPSFLTQLTTLARQSGAFRVRLADTVGIASPTQMSALITHVRATAGPCEIAVHTHNDFGMATANAVTALDAGAQSADVTILGLGERTGCARLEEVVGFLGIMRLLPQFHPEHLKPLAKYVAEIAAMPISTNRPVVGERIFACETGLHLHGLQQNAATYEPFPPELVGAARQWLFGAKSGRGALRRHLLRLGWTVDEATLLAALRTLRDQGFDRKGAFSDEELIAAITSHLLAAPES